MSETPAPGTPAETAEPAPPVDSKVDRPDGRSVMREIAESSTLLIILAIVASLLLSGVLILIADPEFRAALPYFFSRPSDTIQAIGDALGSAYTAIWQGAVYNSGADTFAMKIAPFDSMRKWSSC